MDNQERHLLYSDLLSRHQSQLFAYIFAIVRNREDAADLFQSVCLILWRKFDAFQPGTSFFAWARLTARRVVADFVKRKKMPCYATDELLDALVDTPCAAQSDSADLYLNALQRCRQKLSAADDELLNLRYAEELVSRQIADRLQRPHQSVCNSLTRIRRWLLECVVKEMARQDHPTEEGQ